MRWEIVRIPQPEDLTDRPTLTCAVLLSSEAELGSGVVGPGFVDADVGAEGGQGPVAGLVSARAVTSATKVGVGRETGGQAMSAVAKTSDAAGVVVDEVQQGGPAAAAELLGVGSGVDAAHRDDEADAVDGGDQSSAPGLGEVDVVPSPLRQVRTDRTRLTQA